MEISKNRNISELKELLVANDYPIRDAENIAKVIIEKGYTRTRTHAPRTELRPLDEEKVFNCIFKYNPELLLKTTQIDMITKDICQTFGQLSVSLETLASIIYAKIQHDHGYPYAKMLAKTIHDEIRGVGK